MEWQVVDDRGIRLPQVGWWLDARFPAPRSFVSHAHFDHLAAHRLVVLSEVTARLMSARLPGRREEVALPFGSPWDAPDGSCRFTLHPAGHVFGSAQALVEAAPGRLLYTGDFKLRPGLSAETCATPHADVLVMETTYGRPEYRFPPTAEVLARIIAFCRETIDDGSVPILFGYSLGKCQEILSALCGAALPVMLHREPLRLTRIYESLGVAFPPYLPFDADACAGHVVLAPPQPPQSSFLRRIHNRRTASITGWAMDPGARFRSQSDAAFPLSDHADFDDLIEFVSRVGPRVVHTVHGFASDFAATLRARGIEAWALGEDRQLELSIPAPPRPHTPPPPTPPPATHAPHDPPGTLDAFATAASAAAATPSRLAKVDILARHLEALDDATAPLAALFFAGVPFPPARDRALQAGWSLVKRALLEATGRSEAELRARGQRFADPGETAEALLAGRTLATPLPLAGLAATFEAIADARGPAAKVALLASLFRRLSPAAGKWVVKLVTGDIRMGLRDALVEEAIATSTGRPLDDVRRAHLLCGDLGRVTAAARAGTLARIGLAPFHPVQFMLASPEPDAAHIIARLGTSVWIEEKYDGIRAQLHRAGNRAEIFSRDLHRITQQFPEVAAAAAALPGDAVLDGELLAWSGGRPRPFTDLQRRLGRRGDDFFLGSELPVVFTAYDILWLDGATLLDLPLRSRRARLDALLAVLPADGPLRLAPVSVAEGETAIDAAFLSARSRGNEGLMAKDPESTYSPGRRGLAWLKLKRPFASLDVVVTGAEYGHGRRRGMLSDLTFSVRDPDSGTLLTIGKAYTGLTDAEIATLTTHFLASTLEVRGRLRLVVPDTVLEVAFDTIQPSTRHTSGLALRFPRILRLRPDRSPADADTIDTCRRLAAGAAAFHQAPAGMPGPGPAR